MKAPERNALEPPAGQVLVAFAVTCGRRNTFVLGAVQLQARKPHAKNVAVLDRGRSRKSARGLKLDNERSIAATRVRLGI